jgi:hypothetical protein
MRRQGESRTGTKSEITGRNRNQSTRALAGTDPSASATLQNRLIPMNHAHYDNQPPSSHPPEAPKPRTKPENGSRKPIWPTPAPAGKQPPTTHHTKNRRIPTIRRYYQHQTRSTALPVDRSRELNRKSYYEIEASPRKHRQTPDHQSPRYHKTAKFQQPASAMNTGPSPPRSPQTDHAN